MVCFLPVGYQTHIQRTRPGRKQFFSKLVFLFFSYHSIGHSTPVFQLLPMKVGGGGGGKNEKFDCENLPEIGTIRLLNWMLFYNF